MIRPSNRPATSTCHRGQGTPGWGQHKPGPLLPNQDTKRRRQPQARCRPHSCALLCTAHTQNLRKQWGLQEAGPPRGSSPPGPCLWARRTAQLWALWGGHPERCRPSGTALPTPPPHASSYDLTCRRGSRGERGSERRPCGMTSHANCRSIKTPEAAAGPGRHSAHRHSCSRASGPWSQTATAGLTGSTPHPVTAQHETLSQQETCAFVWLRGTPAGTEPTGPAQRLRRPRRSPSTAGVTLARLVPEGPNGGQRPPAVLDMRGKRVGREEEGLGFLRCAPEQRPATTLTPARPLTPHPTRASVCGPTLPNSGCALSPRRARFNTSAKTARFPRPAGL